MAKTKCEWCGKGFLNHAKLSTHMMLRDNGTRSDCPAHPNINKTTLGHVSGLKRSWSNDEYE